MTNIPDLLTMLKSGVHFGHQLSKRHPKMKPFIFMSKNGFHIIDLEQTQVKLSEALDFVKTIAANGGTVLFLGTKKQAQPIIIKAAKACGMPYITERWLGGTFTNFETISKRVAHFKDLENRKLNGDLAKYTKKEQLMFDKEIESLRKKFEGIKHMVKLPEAVLILDIRQDIACAREAKRKGISIIGVADTNIDPALADYPIPANDDAISSIAYILAKVKEAIVNSKSQTTNPK